MTVNLNNIFVIRTGDKEFEQARIEFLSSHCDKKKVNVAYFCLNDVGAEKVMAIVREK